MALPANHSESTADEDDNYPIDDDPTPGPDPNPAAAPPPIRYLPLDHVYSATSPCPTSSPKKPLLRKFNRHLPPLPHRVPLVHVYSRRGKPPRDLPGRISLFSVLLARENSRFLKEEAVVLDDGGTTAGPPTESNGNEMVAEEKKIKKEKKKRRRRRGGSEHEGDGLVPGRLRERREIGSGNGYCETAKRRKRDPAEAKKVAIDNGNGIPRRKRWVRLSFEGVDPEAFISLQCKIFWPLDADWYTGRVRGYDSETKRHCVMYDDGDKEDLVLVNERVKFYVSHEEVKQLNLKYDVKGLDADLYDYDEMVALAASLDDCRELEPGDIVWAKLTGHAMWPGIVVEDSCIKAQGGLKKISAEKSVYIQFFGTHDFARVNIKHVISFIKGLLSSLHLKCKKPRFIRSLEEAKTYLSEQKLPRRMLSSQNGPTFFDCGGASEDDGDDDHLGEGCMDNGVSKKKFEGLQNLPYILEDLQIINLGKVVKDSEFFKDGNYIWPEGYTAVRKFTSIYDPNCSATYKMEVLRDTECKIRPLFRVTVDGGEQFNGPSPSACWDKIYKKLKKAYSNMPNGRSAEDAHENMCKPGSDMFGFSNHKVMKLIQSISRRNGELPVGFRPVRVDWKDLDKCSVCHMDEEYANNLFLQCDKCRMMVHARCYGEVEPLGGVLWLCNLCRQGAPKPQPLCCLCPVIGGAMKPTTDGRWAHLACAIWIPETCMADVKRMEPIDGISRINKDRWKLLCSICGVSYGACIQCSNNNCRVAYHPLCARAAGLCVELEDEDRLQLLSMEEDEEEQCIRFLSFCKKHKQPSNERPVSDKSIKKVVHQCCHYDPPPNPSGCARCEPYNFSGRRGRKEPEVVAAASLKSLFIENQPYLVRGFSQHELVGKNLPLNGVEDPQYSSNLDRLRQQQVDSSDNIRSMAEKYRFMKETFRRRLAFGKSGIHGFGVFAKQPHRAGDMVIEYTGELVRPPIADRREHFIYNSLVGAGTYMFRIDDERVIDATRAGSIAHLINHSCEPNCHSRVITVDGDEHIIIFAKRDIERWEELTYDYRFFSIDQRLSCYCGSGSCRGVVNDTEAEEQASKLYAPRSELIEWRGE
ncbi:hypothetical protein MLD38_018186 [Melastoma candidum]|uniref:Uncharacterized protein n=1 Tax=Melastoma candidum TaxID=119954 RepID=A0ACB9QS65_9MYRT|nr:hypothetical protein MLD38_018186 [Melastoma candidum]